MLNANGRLDEILAGIKSLGLPILPEHPLVRQRRATVGRLVSKILTATADRGHTLVLYQFPNPTDLPNKQ